MYNLPLWALPNSKPGFYDTESATAIEQTAKLYRAMQDLISEYNSFATKVNENIEKFMSGTEKDYEVFKIALRQEFQDFIDVIELKYQSQDTLISNRLKNMSDTYDNFTLAINTKVNDAVEYMKDNLHGTIESIIVDMRNSGELTDVVMDALDDFTQKLNDLESTFTNLVSDLETELKNQMQADKTELQESIENAFSKIVYVTPEMYGAVGDGVSDDSDAIIQALNSGKIVIFKNTYAISKELQGTAEQVTGANTTIKLLNDVDKVFVLPNASIISGFVFDCSGFGVCQCILATNKNIEISNIEIFDVNDLRADKGSEFICCFENENIHIHDISIHDCNHIINGIIADTPGNISGIYIHNHKTSCVIENVYVKEIHNIDSNGNLMMEDGNGIYVHCINKNAAAFIKNIYGYNYSKRLLKMQCSGEVFIDSVYSYSNSKDHLLSIGILNTEHESQKDYGRATISNCTLINDYLSGIQEQYLLSSGEQVKVVNCKFISKTQMSVYNTGDMIFSNCEIDGYGIQQEGRNLVIDNMRFSGKVFICSFANNTNNIFKITNSEILSEDYNGVVYSEFELNGKSLNMHNVVVSNKDLYIGCDGSISDLKILDSTNSYRLFVDEKIIDLKNITVKAREGTNHTAAITLSGPCVATLENIVTEGFEINVILNGDVQIKGGVDVMKLFKDNLNSIKNKPEYYDELHWSSTIPDGILALLTSDNKLYERQGTEWIVKG